MGSIQPLSLSLSTEGSEGCNTMRRSSSGLLSPPVDGTNSEMETVAFFMLKKDSQRRDTICKVLTDQAPKICDLWMDRLRQDISDLMLTRTHLNALVAAFRDYIPEQNQSLIQQAIGKLKEELDFDGTALHQIQLALYLFQEAMTVILRKQNIKPHWMFALDNLIRNAVHATINVLSPELGRNLAGRDEDEEEGSTSGVSTINSARSPLVQANQNRAYEERAVNSNRLMELRMENTALQDELIKVLEESTSNKKLLINTLKEGIKKDRTLLELVQHWSISELAVSSLPLNNAVNGHTDDRLVQWLNSLDIDAESIAKIIAEGYTKHNLLNDMTREDLRRIGLRGGVELKVWKAIVTHRQPPPIAPRPGRTQTHKGHHSKEKT